MTFATISRRERMPSIWILLLPLSDSSGGG